MSTKSTRVQQLLDEHGSITFPGVYDTLSAKLAEHAGFPIGFISGYSVAATQIGEPDMGLLTQTEMVAQARAVCSAVKIPIIVDADTGYGNPLNVMRTVEELIKAGAAGCFLEDQVWPKRCGHMRNKKVIDRDEYLQKIRAAVDAKAGADFFIVARTDALAAVNMDEAVARVSSAREAGADASFIEAPASEHDLEQIGQRSPAPNVANMIEGGATPVLSHERLTQLGFHLILHPLAGLYAAAQAIQRTYERLRKHGVAHDGALQPMGFAAFNELIGVEEKYRTAARYGAD